MAGALLAGLAAVLFLMPLLRSLPVAKKLHADLSRTFGEVPFEPGDRPAPLRFRDLLLGIRRRRFPVQTVTYAQHAGQELKMDIIRPETGPAPVVLIIHGGSWRGGDRTQLASFNHALAARGFVVASMQYRLAPEHPFPAAKEDVQAALAYLKAHAAELGADPTRIALLGRSAGAQLAVLTAYTEKDPAIRGVISVYGPFDLAWGHSLPGWILDSKGILEGYLGGSPQAVPEAYEAASPMTFVGPHVPPTLLIQGEADVLVSPLHSVKLEARLQGTERPYYTVWVPLATHGSDFFPNGPFGQISTYAVERFLRAVMR